MKRITLIQTSKASARVDWECLSYNFHKCIKNANHAGPKVNKIEWKEYG